MSEENVEVIRDCIAAMNEGDYGRAMGHLADDVVLGNPAGVFAGTFRGREAVGEWFGDWFRTFDWNVHIDIREIGERGAALMMSSPSPTSIAFAKGRSRGWTDTCRERRPSKPPGCRSSALDRESVALRRRASSGSPPSRGSREEALEAAGLSE